MANQPQPGLADCFSPKDRLIRYVSGATTTSHPCEWAPGRHRDRKSTPRYSASSSSSGIGTAKGISCLVARVVTRNL